MEGAEVASEKSRRIKSVATPNLSCRPVSPHGFLGLCHLPRVILVLHSCCCLFEAGTSFLCLHFIYSTVGLRVAAGSPEVAATKKVLQVKTAKCQPHSVWRTNIIFEFAQQIQGHFLLLLWRMAAVRKATSLLISRHIHMYVVSATRD